MSSGKALSYSCQLRKLCNGIITRIFILRFKSAHQPYMGLTVLVMQADLISVPNKWFPDSAQGNGGTGAIGFQWY